MSKLYTYNDINFFDTYEECADELRNVVDYYDICEYGFGDLLEIVKHGMKGDVDWFQMEYEEAFQRLCENAITEWEDEDDE